MFFKRFGLQSKIIIIFAAVVMSVLGVSTYIASLLTRQLVEEAIYRKALAQARATADHLLGENDLQNPESLLRVLKQMQHDFPGVKQSDVFLHDGVTHLVATTDPQGAHLELDEIKGIEHYNEFERPDDDQVTIETPDGRYWVMSTMLRDQGRPIGCLTLTVSKYSSNVVIAGLVRRNLLLMLASLLAVMLVIHVFFLRNVHRPVKEMIRVMEGAEGGQLDVRARVKSLDEVSQLAEHLNLMLDRIRNFNNELSGKVHEATSELAERNQELTRINEELFETQKNLARSERLAVAGQLAASLAHEIGTPLNSISGHVQLMARRKTGDEAHDRRLQIIENQIENIVRTVRQLLSWTRKFELHIEPLDLRRVLEESVLLSSPALEARKIKVRMEAGAAVPGIYGDAGYLQQVFLNLINNSMDAMPRGGTLRLRLKYPVGGAPHRAAPEGTKPAVGIEVEDTGEGIPREMLVHIFDPMFTTKRIGTGAGLGLAICQQIVQQHGGTIAVESEPHRGTQFTLVLPLDCREKHEFELPGVGAAVNELRDQA
ncbi:MAG TPA: ATP-binding protein [Terriglobia bacterium]|nr:ATP-binding protein [Terriglobia bacterium]